MIPSPAPAGRAPLLPHLHLHLEPEERKRRELGMPGRNFGDRHLFFEAHRVDRADAVPVTVRDLRRFLADVHTEQREQGVHHAELRLSPRRFLREGMSWRKFTDTVQDCLAPLCDPVVRAVLLINRDSPAPFLAMVSERIAELPPVFTGVDLAGDEVRHPDVRPAVPLFRAAADSGLGRTVHAGEFGPEEHIWRALDVLGAQRIGHGVSAATGSALLRRMARDGILLEVSLTSNVALGAVPGPAAHPLPAFLEAGVPVAFNSDVPLHTGRTLVDELRLASDALGAPTEVIRDLQSRAARHCFTRRPPLRSGSASSPPAGSACG
ncbi:hypothetical protein E5082_05955 [Streptomyces griseoluteus]|uniref:adenosine deaminase n=1 Tax=Streptomyces griseoluteus TaxID=29306 RepID=A0A4Z1DPI1_STRGP|nr:hypothetical protein [Streptomyces griseoluteus]TGN85642.1 hypothetical protein E5082_05955 [Streptomyces griseoluteus]GHE92204.1 hypothetical protein GCM10017776_05720 [Streptomyces griseoluteus]